MYSVNVHFPVCREDYLHLPLLEVADSIGFIDIDHRYSVIYYCVVCFIIIRLRRGFFDRELLFYGPLITALRIRLYGQLIFTDVFLYIVAYITEICYICAVQGDLRHSLCLFFSVICQLFTKSYLQIVALIIDPDRPPCATIPAYIILEFVATAALYQNYFSLHLAAGDPVIAFNIGPPSIYCYFDSAQI